ncbi:helix-turn-helix domain-containing protein [Crenobacter luteus]|uniref:helix-turn-helix domain-containing protein n=1 Tax=Crenobacter luteus TaxID=1452487 RepID=UPI0009EE708C|nr:helix-turn-helix transcriptional regulator [Crenobacter luteus]
MSQTTFAARLKGVLDTKRIMLKQVAEALSVSPSAVHKWTRGGEIEYGNLRALADFLEVNWIWLRYGEEAVGDLEAASNGDPHIRAIRQKHLTEIMESEARMKFAQEVSGIVTWEWNVLTDAVNYSSNAEKLFGRPIRLIEDFWAAVHPDDVAPLRAALEAALARLTPYEAEFRVKVGDEVRWIASRATQVADADRRPLKMIGISIDVTARRLAEAARRKSEAILAKAQAIAHLGSWFWDIQNDDCAWSDEAYRIFGWEPQAFKVTMERYFASIVEEDRARIDEAIRLAIEEGRPYAVDYTIALPDGNHRAIHEEGEVEFDATGRALTMIGASQDVTERKLAELAYRESEERFREIFEQAAVGIAHVGLDGRWLKVNRKLADIVGYGPAELESLSFQDLTHPDDLDENLAQLDSLLSGAIATYSIEKRFVKKNGEVVWVNVTTSLSRHPLTREPLHLITVIEDISEKQLARQRIEDAYRRSELALQSIGMASWDWDLVDGRVTLSAAAAQLIGLPDGTAALDEAAFLAGIRVASRTQWLASLDAIFAVSSRAQLDVSWHGDGRPVALTFSVVPVRDAQGAMTRLIGALGSR